MKARLISKQKGCCGIWNLPDDIIERDHIKPKTLGSKNKRENVHAVHRNCPLEKTRADLLELHRL
jgi:RNA-directed DNA polymerase